MLAKLSIVKEFNPALYQLEGASFATQTLQRCLVRRMTANDVGIGNVWV